ncbi:DNA-3-methyladenine glycosylase I [Nitratidesulfovibrio sp.]|uniref:DNA-3-methyladenine glycosylase I n=1 Tax=Nitratidesulfovibrio sp. TaxID=2802297 RepID=UPI00333E900D
MSAGVPEEQDGVSGALKVGVSGVLKAGVTRCPWARAPEEIAYHDTEWGVPVRDDRIHFEFLVLEAAQAGLSWLTILRKREGYRRLFADFDPTVVARYTQADVERLLGDAAIVRNRLKVESAVHNARLFLDVQARHGSFDAFIWNFVDGRPVCNQWRELAQVPATTPLSDTVSRELKRLGFKFVGSTVIYAHLQATGLVNDHLTSCFRHAEVAAERRGHME